ncbi:hypothetical protein TNCV_2717381 [Trichonephila clavipes]|nr:hypothetical protein TNCV_2717381 [Trichonephila clavipes]
MICVEYALHFIAINLDDCFLMFHFEAPRVLLKVHILILMPDELAYHSPKCPTMPRLRFLASRYLTCNRPSTGEEFSGSKTRTIRPSGRVVVYRASTPHVQVLFPGWASST